MPCSIRLDMRYLHLWNLKREKAMVNLSKCKFGDRFKTKGGRMAIFLHKSFVYHEVYICAIERDKCSRLEMKYRSDGKRYFDNEPSEYDIKCKWEDEK